MEKPWQLVDDHSGVTYDYSALNVDELLASVLLVHIIIASDFIVSMKEWCLVFTLDVILQSVNRISYHVPQILTCSNFFI